MKVLKVLCIWHHPFDVLKVTNFVPVVGATVVGEAVVGEAVVGLSVVGAVVVDGAGEINCQ